MANRARRIVEIISERKRAEVSALAEELGVSQVTIRKDLNDLEQRGVISREHGFAMIKSADNVEGRIAYHYAEKTQIARRAVECVHDGDAIMIESGSCCALLAAELVNAHHELTIITNSAFIANYIRNKSDFKIILLGGIYQQDSQVMVGPMVEQCVQNFYVDTLFIGVDGYSRETGFTNRDQMRAQAIRDMSAHAERVVILTESDKFTRRSTVPLSLHDKPCIVITDARLDTKTTCKLRDKVDDLILVSSQPN